MSRKHPIVAVTGSSGAGTSTARAAFEGIFRELNLKPVYVQGDSYHRYSRDEMQKEIRRAHEAGRVLSHFGPGGNLFEELEALFAEYARTGTGQRRFYLHNAEEVAEHDHVAREGDFTPWEAIPDDTDILFYEGLHGGIVTEEHNVAKYVDLLVGVTPIVNLEWIQKIHRDAAARGYAPEDTVETIKRRMHDYVEYITPQFSRTDINFQRVPLVDTSNPFVAHDVPSPDESLMVIRLGNRPAMHLDFPYLLSMLHGSFMSRSNTLVVPGGKLGFAMELILTPFMQMLVRGERIRD